jgi:hypothetical protein
LAAGLVSLSAGWLGDARAAPAAAGRDRKLSCCAGVGHCLGVGVLGEAAGGGPPPRGLGLPALD